MEKKKPIVCGIQQIGIGVSNIEEAYDWYKRFFGTDVVVFDEKAAAEYMLPYTEGKPRNRRAVLAMNMQGGGGFEIWQHRDFEPRKPKFDVLPGDYGVWACKIKCKNAAAAHRFHLESGGSVSEIYTDVLGREYYYLTDIYDNKFQVVEIKPKEAWFKNDHKHTGGVYGAIVGTKDMDAAIRFYSNLLGYDKVYKDNTDVYEDLARCGAMGVRFRRVLLGHSQERKGAFSQLLGPSEIELIQALDRAEPCRLIYEDRMWGEPGFIQICYDIRHMDLMREAAKEAGHSFTVDSISQNPDFDMGDAAGSFAYNEDPSGTLIEYVETRKVSILKKFNLALDLSKRDPEKALPHWMASCLRFLKKEKI